MRNILILVILKLICFGRDLECISITINIGTFHRGNSPAVSLAIQDTMNQLVWPQNITFRVVYRNQRGCSDYKRNVLDGLDMYFKDGIDVLIGQRCSEVCSELSYYFESWNIPIFTELCGDETLADKSIYGNLIRVGGTNNNIGHAFREIFRYYGWRRAIIMHDESDLCSLSGISIYTFLTQDNVVIAEYIQMPQVNEITNENLEDYMNRIQSRARIVIYCFVREYMQERFLFKAQDRGMDNGEYAFLMYQNNPDEDELEPFFTVKPGEPEFEYRKMIFAVTKMISFASLSTEKFENLSQRMIDISDSELWNGTTIDPSNYALYLYDSTVLYLLSLHNVLTQGFDYKNYSNILRGMRNTQFEGKSGEVEMDDDGDRIMQYSMWDFLPDVKKFTDYMKIDFTSKQTIHILRDTYWSPSVSNQPPKDTPLCGFNKEKCPLFETTSAILVSLAGVAAILIGISLVFFHRKKQYEAQVSLMLWRVPFSEIRLRNVIGGSSVLRSMGSLASFQQNDTADSSRRTAVYRNQMVEVIFCNQSSVSLTKKDKLEINKWKELKHDNIVRFVGACIEPEHVCVLMQCCSRGSLMDIIHNENINLDETFKISLLVDVVKGMNYLHKSDLYSHGQLKSSNCFVDSRWVLKIGGLTVNAFNIEDNHVGETEHYRELLWTAPELLRLDRRPTRGSQKGDVYSFGVIVQEVIYRALPLFSDQMEPKDIIAKIKAHGNTPYRPVLSDESPDVNETFVSLIRSCWSENMTDRPNFNEIGKILSFFGNERNKSIMDIMMHKLEKYASNLESIVRQRTAELTEEKFKTDQLLYRLLPSAVAELLKQGLLAEPKVYSCVTMYYSDIVGFTRFSSQCTAFEVVDFLNKLYTAFDTVLEKHDVYKVETIGDAYVVVSGAPETNGNNHVGEIASMALELRSEMNSFRIDHMPDYRVKLRSGFHTGPCAAGVVGLTMPRYCMFGETVLLASKMESTGEALMIQLSQSSNELLLRNFRNYETSFRGLVSINQHEKLETYWLIGKRDPIKDG